MAGREGIGRNGHKNGVWFSVDGLRKIPLTDNRPPLTLYVDYIKMAKKVKAVIKLYCPAGQANPAPPVGPALGQHGLNIMEFCKQFNAKTKEREGLILPVIVTAYEDKSFTFIIKSPPTPTLLKRACGIAKASGTPHKEKAGGVTKEQVMEIAKIKLKDLNTDNLEKAIKIVEGTARSMGIEVVEKLEKKAPGEDEAPDKDKEKSAISKKAEIKSEVKKVKPTEENK